MEATASQARPVTAAENDGGFNQGPRTEKMISSETDPSTDRLAVLDGDGQARRAATRLRKIRMEAVVAIIVSAAALATSWASYQATLWNGRQAASYSRAGAARTMATRDAVDASVTRSVEISLFTSWLDAKYAGNSELADFYRQRFPPDLKAAFEDWWTLRPLDHPDAPTSPFAMPSYRQPGLVEAKAMEGRATAEFNAGQRANLISNDYTRSAVFLAMAMFFGAVGRTFDSPRVRIAMATVSLFACAAGLISILSLPTILHR